MTLTTISLFNRKFSEYSDNRALITADGTCLTFRQVKERAARLATFLKKKNVKDGELVAILMERNTDYLIVVATCLLFGYGFVPMDVEYPKDRIEMILCDSKAVFVVDSDAFRESEKEEPRQDVPTDICAQNVAYEVFTSGSTGRPKGIMHDQESFALAAMRNSKAFGLGCSDIWGATAPFTFVAIIPEIAASWVSGVGITVVPRLVVNDPELLSKYIWEKGITATFIPVRILRLFKKTGDKFRFAITGGEKLSNIGPCDFRLMNGYGQSETCAVCVFFEVKHEYDTVPLGSPSEDVSMYILDENGKEADEGEICLAGHFMTGYINQPELTKKTIVKNPFEKLDGHSELLHTGDLGKRLENGEVVYVNRKDWMIKINGQRVEPGEIESVLKKTEGVSDAVVKDFVNRYDQPYLCAYYTEKKALNPEELRSILQHKLPSYMVPSFFVRLDSMPLNANKKLDRSALKQPDASQFLVEYSEPVNSAESIICSAFSKVLGIPGIGAADDFFKLGGDSIKAAIAANECSSAGITVRDIFVGKTPREIAKLANSKSEKTGIEETELNEMPLCDGQMGVYLDSSEGEPDCRYNIPFVFSFSAGTVDVETLKKAVEGTLKKHQAFSIRIKKTNGVPVMTRAEGFPEIEVSCCTEGEFEQIKSCFVKPFNLDGKPLYRIRIVKTDLNIHLLFDIHHLIFDGTSLELYKKLLICELNNEQTGTEVITPFMVSASELRFKGSEEEKKCLDFYKETLNGIDVDSNLNPDVFIPEMQNLKGSEETSVDMDCKSVEFFTSRLGITENTLFAAAFALVLAKFTCQKESLFQSVENGRHLQGMENSIGMFVKSFPVYIEIDENKSTKEYLTDVQTKFFDFMVHDSVSFADIVHTCEIDTSVRFVYQSEMLEGFDYNQARVGVQVLPVSEAMANLELMVLKQNGGYKVSVGYRKSMYSPLLIKSFARAYCTIVKELICCSKLKDMDLLPKEQQAVLDSFNSTELLYDNKLTVVDSLKAQVISHPNKTAVSFKEKKLTYSEFDRITDTLASYLVSKGIGCNSFVPVMTSRNHFMPILAWGVVKAGAAYQPLDPSYPAERLNFMVNDSSAKLLIADRNLAGLLSEYKGQILYTDEVEKLPYSENFKCKVKPEDNLVLLYTSGTTGLPKGIILNNRNIYCFVVNHKNNFEIDSDSNVANYAGFGFDACMMDIFSTLSLGATLCIIPEEIRLDLKALNNFYNENEITHGFITTQLGCMFAQMVDSKSLKYIEVGGEKLIPFEPSDKFKVKNGYGPSETTAYVTNYIVNNSGPIQPIGKPSNNTKLYIVDSFGRRLPIGACGELLISGPQVSCGYLNRPDKTKEAFISNSFSKDPEYSTVYKSGDIVRILPDGNYDFIGRRDAQVKIRGFRIELTEIEQVIKKFNSIKNATVQAFDDPCGGKFIAAYVVSDVPIDIEKLNSFIGQEKPSYMVPSVTMQIDSIPFTPNGKVDKRKLPVPQHKAEEIVKPKNEMQKKILDLVCSVLGSQDIGITTDIFRSGLTSLGSVRLNSLLSDNFNVVVQSRNIKENPTVEKLESFILSSEEEEKTSVVYPDYPLTKTQEGIFLECQNNLESTVYNIPYLLKIGRRIDEKRLKMAICEAVQAHNYINTTLFFDGEGNIRQKLAPIGAFTAEDVQSIEVSDIENVRGKLVSPFKLIGGKLFKISVIRTMKELFLFLDFHHIISDGTSMEIFLSDVEQAYFGKTPAEETFTGYDVSMAEQKMRNSHVLFEAEEYYQNLLSGFDTDFLPKPDFHFYSTKGTGKLTFTGVESEALDITTYCKRNNVSENSVLCAAFGHVLALYNGTDTSMFTTVYHGRNDSRMGRTVSMLVKTLPVLFNPQDCSTVEVVSSMSKQLVDSMSNDIYSFAEISRRFGVKSDVMFIFQGDGFENRTFCNEDCSSVELQLSDNKAPLAIQVVRKDNRYVYSIDYNTELFTCDFAEDFVRAIDCVVSQLSQSKKLSDISLLDEKTLSVIDSCNNCETNYDKSKNCVDLLKENVKLYPENKAVVFKEFSYTFREFDQLTDRLGAYLISKGTKRNSFVGIITSRNQFMPVCAWGVVKSGAAYLPIDPTYPKERIELMLKDSDVKFLIAEKGLSDCIDEIVNGFSGEVLFINDIENLPVIENPVAENPGVEIDREDPFIIIYSSGSTGVPKGSVLPHRSLSALSEHFRDDLGLEPGDRIASYASFGFDAGLLDIFCSLMNGFSQYIIPEELRLDIMAMDKFFIDNEINGGFMTTQVARTFLQNTKCKTLKTFLFGGEKMVSFEPPKWIRVYNGYGPSETNNYVTAYRIKDNNPVQPIGKQSSNTKLYVLDKNGKRLPPYACGELCISGPQVAIGYLNRPEKNVLSFVNNPFSGDSDYRTMYKTGDIVRMFHDGNYDFVGRRDGQVKIRGFRIELGEIESVISSYPSVKQVTVQAFDAASGGKFIAAYVVCDGELDEDSVADFIRQIKPSYMVPASIMKIDSIPLTSNGKVNKAKLPLPKVKSEENGEEPVGATETKLCELYASLLGLEKVYADDNFFEIGGSSISALQLVVKCVNAGLMVVYKNLFENPTPRQLAKLIESGTGNKEVYAPTGDSALKYNYSALDYNVVENIEKIENNGVGDVLLTGATGFLGVHVLKYLMNNTDSKVICIVRSKDGISSSQRLQIMTEYYFEDDFSNYIGTRVFIVDSTITDSDLSKKLGEYSFDTIINCAANVHHFGSEEALMRDNYQGIQTLIDIAMARNAKFVQTSSMSVSGENVNGRIPENFIFRENNLNVGQSLENLYVRSKYMAEQEIIDSISKGLRGKIIRLGNLMARGADGEFQINTSNNGFINILNGYRIIGCYPFDYLDYSMELSPIDYVAKAVVLLSGTPDSFTVFHAYNVHNVHIANIFEIMNQLGLKVDYVDQTAFTKRFDTIYHNEKYAGSLSGILSYQNKAGGNNSSEMDTQEGKNSEEKGVRTKVHYDNTYTVKALYRLGFSWPLTDNQYLYSLIKNLKDLNYFSDFADIPNTEKGE